MKKLALAALLSICSVAAFANGSATATATLNLTVASYISIGAGSGTVVFATQSGADSAVAAGNETFTVSSNSRNGYTIGTVAVTGNATGLPVVAATATVGTGQGTAPTASDTLKIAFTETTTWLTPTTSAALVYTATVTLTNNS